MKRSFGLFPRLRALLGPDTAGARQSLVALSLNSSTSLVAGAVLGSLTATFEEFPGLLVLVPAAIGLRGNIFGAFGNRISTTLHSGTFRLSMRRETVLGQNVAASLILTAGMSMLLALVAKAAAVGLGLPDSIALLDLSTISIVGGVLASAVVLAGTLGLTAGAVRYGWDLDNVAAPLVSVMGDVVTIPALFAATVLVGIHIVTPTLGSVLLVASVVVLAAGLRSRLPLLRRIVWESLPVLLVAGCVSAGAGIALEKSFGSFSDYPALLVLVPAHLSSAGALGGILSGRLSTKLLLGLVAPAATPDRDDKRDIGLTLLIGAPVYLLNGLGAHVVGELTGSASPGLPTMLAVSLLGGMAAMLVVVVIAYYGTIASVRTGVDPDTYGIPIVSSTVDFVGAIALIITIAALGVPG